MEVHKKDKKQDLCVISMENQVFRCTQRAITQRSVITLGPIFTQMVLKQAQGSKEKSQEVSVRKNINQRRYNKKCRGGRIPPPPPGSFRVKIKILHAHVQVHCEKLPTQNQSLLHMCRRAGDKSNTAVP